MLRFAFWLTALLILPLGLGLYWLPQESAAQLGPRRCGWCGVPGR
ncbi:hypothetical protein [Deinococcus radiophilus]